MAELDRRGIRYLTPTGAFYLWIDVSHASGGDVTAWCERFLDEAGVAVAPGTAFGASGEGWIRVCVASDRESLLEGLRRLPAADRRPDAHRPHRPATVESTGHVTPRPEAPRSRPRPRLS